jgi:hypothetical protein
MQFHYGGAGDRMPYWGCIGYAIHQHRYQIYRMCDLVYDPWETTTGTARLPDRGCVMNDMNIRFASIFRCPAPCKAEVLVEQTSLSTCPVCGKAFDRRETTELLLSQGRFFDETDSESNCGEASSTLPGSTA